MDATHSSRKLAALIAALLCTTLLLIAACGTAQHSALATASTASSSASVQTSSTSVSLPTDWACEARMDDLEPGYSEPVAYFHMCLRYLADQGIRVAEDEFGWDACSQGNGTGTRPDGVVCRAGTVVADPGLTMTTPIR